MRNAVKRAAWAAPDRLKAGFEPPVERRHVDQPDVVELVARNLAQCLVDGPIDGVALPVGPDDLRRVGAEASGFAILEIEQVEGPGDPLVVGEAITPRDHQSAEMAVAMQRPGFR